MDIFMKIWYDLSGEKDNKKNVLGLGNGKLDFLREMNWKDAKFLRENKVKSELVDTFIAIVITTRQDTNWLISVNKLQYVSIWRHTVCASNNKHSTNTYSTDIQT